jgi:hypothetical protein
MNDFFAGIHNIGQPDVVMNSGPLPPTTVFGNHPGFDGTPDGKINATDALLSNVAPYAYGEGARPGTQAAYLNIPHMVQRIVPIFKLPEPMHISNRNFFEVSHGVCDGDVAFILRVNFAEFAVVVNRTQHARRGNLQGIDVLVNLQTANYILHGLQRFVESPQRDEIQNWAQLYHACGLQHYFDSISDANDDNQDLLVKILTQQVIRPFGVPVGSSKQGGQDQGVVQRTVTWPTDHVLSLLVDGKCKNMLNFWRSPHEPIQAGDDLIFKIEKKMFIDYELSSHDRSFVHKSFSEYWERADHPGYYQMVPCTHNPGLPVTFSYWHIARSEIYCMRQPNSRVQNVCTLAPSMNNGKLIDCSFEPLFYDNNIRTVYESLFPREDIQKREEMYHEVFQQHVPLAEVGREEMYAKTLIPNVIPMQETPKHYMSAPKTVKKCLEPVGATVGDKVTQDTDVLVLTKKIKKTPVVSVDSSTVSGDSIFP